MKIAIIPDCHLKKRDESSDFYFSDDEMFQFLVDLGSKVDEVYLIGDFVELWQGKWPTNQSQVEEYHLAYNHYKKTFNLILSNDKYYLVEGNHDEFLKFIYPINSKVKLQYVRYNKDFNKIYINHGIRDLFNKNLKLRKLTRIGSWIVGIIEKLVFKNWELSINKVLTSIFHIEVVGTNKKQISHFKELINGDDSYIVYIAGHTHKPQILRFLYKEKERLFINAGYFDGVENFYCILDTDTLEVDPYKIIDINLKDFRFNLSKGDILLSYKKGNVLSSGIAAVTESEYSHALMYIGNNQVIESIGSGVQISPVDKYFSGDYDVCKISLIDNSKIDKVISLLHSKLGLKYGYLQNFLSLITIIFNKILRKDVRKYIELNEENYNCSELIASSIKEVYGYNYNSANFFPSDFLSYTQYFKYEKKIAIDY